MRLFIRFLLIVTYLSFSTYQSYAASDSYTGYNNARTSFDRNAIVAIKVASKRDFCSGVVISPNEVLTATHCVYSLKDQQYFPVNTITIGVGDNIMDEHFQWFKVKDISSKASITINTVSDFLGNDIVRLNTANLLPVTPVSISSYTNSSTRLFSWGFGEDEWGYYGIKKSRALENATLQDKLIVFSSGACRGDSGGPVLNENNQVVGIISLSKVRHCVSNGQRIAQRIFK